MDKLRQLLQEALDENLIRLIISGSRDKEKAEKITVRPVMKKGKLQFQETLYRNRQVFHKTYDKKELPEAVTGWMQDVFRQLELDTETCHATALVGKRGTVTVKKKQRQEKQDSSALSHNRKKNYILKEGTPVPFLTELGVMTPEGKVVNSHYDKFRQINRFLEFVEDVLPALPKDRPLTIIDFGCGKSYLTFAMYYDLRILKGYDVRMTGLDLKREVIEKCNELAGSFHYDQLQFLQGDIAEYNGVDRADMVVTLHACDTATDLALAKAVQWKAKVILSVPCCQHQLNREIDCSLLQPVFRYGIIRERTAALFTDGMRAELLRSMGYQVQLLEFIDMEHTPKNILIRGVYGKGAGQRTEEYEKLRAFLGAEPLLARLLDEMKENDGEKDV